METEMNVDVESQEACEEEVELINFVTEHGVTEALRVIAGVLEPSESAHHDEDEDAKVWAKTVKAQREVVMAAVVALEAIEDLTGQSC